MASIHFHADSGIHIRQRLPAANKVTAIKNLSRLEAAPTEKAACK
jgi:hypothetical protein